MLKITLNDHPRQLCLRLEGRLGGAWVNELRQCWLTATSTTQDRSILVDLSEVDFVCPEAQALLTEMARSGVQFKAVTPLIRSTLAEIERSAQYATVEEQQLRRSDVLASSDPSTRNPGAL
jgi:hypothetical protein